MSVEAAARRNRIFLASAFRVGALVVALSLVQGAHFTVFQLKDQDRPVLIGLVGLLVLLHFAPPLRLRFTAWPGPRLLVAMLAAIALCLWGLTQALMRDFALSYDEFMVLFDRQVFADGRLATPFPPEWRDYTRNLVPTLLLNEYRPDALVSAYLPMNALLRLGFSQALPASLMNPLLFLLGGVALLDIARNQFGKDREAILVVFLLYSLSMQAWTVAMTPYAMTAHLTFNLVWLAAFLRGGWWHAVAIAAGVVATGLHQLVFHPLFVAPFLLQRLLRGEWRLVAGYAAAYAVICAGWIAYPMLASGYAGGAVPSGSPAEFLRDRVWPLVAAGNSHTLMLMVMNVLRFFAWQHLALLPLLTLAVAAVRRDDGLTRPLMGGVLLALALIALLLPFQGHGWGYRYLHGWIGSCALLGGFGYRELRGIMKDKAAGAIALATLATLTAMAWLAYRIDAFVAPHVALERRLAAMDADMVLIESESFTSTRDGRWAPNALDLVRNRPDLSNRPLRFSSQLMTPEMAARLCRRGSIALIDRTAQKQAGFSLTQPGPSRHLESLRAAIEAEARAGRCRLADAPLNR